MFMNIPEFTSVKIYAALDPDEMFVMMVANNEKPHRLASFSFVNTCDDNLIKWIRRQDSDAEIKNVYSNYAPFVLLKAAELSAATETIVSGDLTEIIISL